MAAPLEHVSQKGKCPCGKGAILEIHVEINPNSNFSRDEYSYKIACEDCKPKWRVQNETLVELGTNREVKICDLQQ